MEETTQYGSVCVVVREDGRRELPACSVGQSFAPSVSGFGGKSQMEICETPRPYSSPGLWTSPIPTTVRAKTAKVQLPSTQGLLQCFYLAPVPGGGAYAKPWRSNRAWSSKIAVVSPSATMRPAFITTVREHRDLTSARSWVAMSWVG